MIVEEEVLSNRKSGSKTSIFDRKWRHKEIKSPAVWKPIFLLEIHHFRFDLIILLEMHYFLFEDLICWPKVRSQLKLTYFHRFDFWSKNGIFKPWVIYVRPRKGFFWENRRFRKAAMTLLFTLKTSFGKGSRPPLKLQVRSPPASLTLSMHASRQRLIVLDSRGSILSAPLFRSSGLDFFFRFFFHSTRSERCTWKKKTIK